jgi:hypothetical protein
MLDLIVKLLIVIFCFSIGCCFVFWPENVLRFIVQHHKQKNQTKASDIASGSIAVRSLAHVIWIRQMGILIIALVCYVVYLWLRG